MKWAELITAILIVEMTVIVANSVCVGAAVFTAGFLLIWSEETNEVEQWKFKRTS